MLSNLRKYFISGLLIWLPIWVTLLVINFLVNLLNKSLLLLPPRLQPDTLLGFHVPFVGVAITLLVILITGLLVANFAGRRMIEVGDALMERIPLVRSVYSSVKQVTVTLFSRDGQSFRKVLLVEYPSPGIYTIAFQIGETPKEIADKKPEDEMVTYFVPTTPNPTSGFVMMAPKSRVVELNMSVDQALKFIISLGVVQPYTSGIVTDKPDLTV